MLRPRTSWDTTFRKLEEAPQKIEREPSGEVAARLAEEGLWAANELERDLRELLHAR